MPHATISSENSNSIDVSISMSELALDAAIALERFKATGDQDLTPVSALADALTANEFGALELVPVYHRALAGEGIFADTKNDLFSKIHDIARQLKSSEKSNPTDLNLLIEFCAALHDSLVTNGLQNLRQDWGGRSIEADQ